jgi:alanyl-tRNA synthetase
MTVRELRQKYLAFFESKGHTRHASGSLVPIDVTGRLDESLLFNGAGMVQFKPYFRGVAEPPNRRLTNAQKCLRTGDIESVGDPTHLTFFEMMGNFSFGDYFKEEAIAYSWEFLTSPEWLGLDPGRLSFTVFEEDEESLTFWSKHVAAAGMDPASRVFKLDEETNYWPAGSFTNGPPGPCGPNTEMFYWVPADVPPPGVGYTREDWQRDEAKGLWLEVWNDVFIQYEWQGEPLPEGGHRKTGMPPLPFKSVDTGMGLERTAAVLGGHGSVYDTDAFQPILAAIEGLRPGLRYGADPASDTAMRIVADHLRAGCFCVADGVLPSNTGRGYVLRRLLRRAVLKGQRALGFDEPFLHQLVGTVVSTFGDHYVELAEKRAVVEQTLLAEERQFRRTLREGTEMLAEELGRAKGRLSGEAAFRLYDTFGFPLEVTQEVCAERGIGVDLDGYKKAMGEAQERSRAADERESVYGGVVIGIVFTTDDGLATPTEFRGYDETVLGANVVGAVPLSEDGRARAEFAVALDRTPFYAESGGQVADTGVIEGDGFRLQVRDVTKQDGVFVHLVESDAPLGHEGLAEPEAVQALNKRLFRQMVEARVDEARRQAVVRNHTGTHLLHAALRSVLGPHVTQAGSLVAPDHLRFDFTHGQALSESELAQVERIVNEHVLAAQPVTVYTDVPIDEARSMGAMALFGEKYADRVRVVQIGDMAPQQPSFSRELCGGVHVRNTGQIGMVKVLHEASAASGVRRIEAVTGFGAYDWAVGQQQTLAQAAERLKSNPKDLVAGVERLLEQVREERRKRERLAQQGTGQAETTKVGPVELAVEKLTDADAKDAQLVADRLVDGRPDRVAFVANVAGGKVTLVAKAGDAAVKAGANAGNLVKAAAIAAGGGGGGRPDFATAGAKDVGKLGDAIAAAQAELAKQVG